MSYIDDTFVGTIMALHGLESAPSDYLEKYENEREFAA